jgi:hypothetical protein
LLGKKSKIGGFKARRATCFVSLRHEGLPFSRLWITNVDQTLEHLDGKLVDIRMLFVEFSAFSAETS